MRGARQTHGLSTENSLETCKTRLRICRPGLRGNLPTTNVGTSGFGSNLDGASHVSSLTINGQTFLYVSATFSDTLSVYQVTIDGVAQLQQTITGNGSGGSLPLNGIDTMLIVEVGGSTFLYANSE